ncbi:hypothetical protein [Microvirga aerophila]|uniref:hypothetical protein n=1 Tax=Microvirga aerophila TaxID=670291 RepID=UPI0011BF313A|nr:hypothetical protein [Microvirga aerophila]
MGSDRQNLLNFCIELLVDDLGQNNRIVRVHRAGRVDLKRIIALDDNRVTIKPQHTVGLTHQPFRHAVACFKRLSLLRHCEPLLG